MVGIPISFCVQCACPPAVLHLHVHQMLISVLDKPAVSIIPTTSYSATVADSMSGFACLL